jgi:hypothetical protein
MFGLHKTQAVWGSQGFCKAKMAEMQPSGGDERFLRCLYGVRLASEFYTAPAYFAGLSAIRSRADITHKSCSMNASAQG